VSVLTTLRLGLFGLVTTLHAQAQTATDLKALELLAPVTALHRTPEGNAALGSNFVVTGGIQTGAIALPTLLPFAQQQQQALKDVFITSANFAQLADGLGTTLGSAFLARAHYVYRNDKKATHFTKLVARIIAYAFATTQANATSGKFFFANETTDGKTPVSVDAKAIMANFNGAPDMFGVAYGFPAGSAGADKYGNSRPFQTEPLFARIIGPDYFSNVEDNIVYNRGVLMNLVDSPSYPSGHTTYGYTGAIVLAMLVPERYPEMMVRAAEYGTDRIIMGAHYAMDVIGGRTLALYDMAHLLANDPMYLGQKFKNTDVVIDNFKDEILRARKEVIDIFQAACGDTIAKCATQDTGRMSQEAANASFYASTLTYNLPVVYPTNANALEDVAKVAPEAGHLLTVAFPYLTLEQANKILTETEGPGGGFLDIDDRSFKVKRPLGVYSRLNLYAASKRAAELAPSHP
jgi:hypothetical protein